MAFLVGDNTAYSSSSVYLQFDGTHVVQFRQTGYTASATGTVSKGYFRFGTGTLWGTAAKLLVYNSSHALIGTSDELTSLTNNAWNQFNFTGGPTITSGQLYYLGLACNGDMDVWVGPAASGWYLWYSSAGSYASPPTTLTESGNFAHDDYGVYVESAAGGTSHPYTGSQGVGALTHSAGTILAKGKTPSVGGAQVFSAATVRARGKSPSVGGTMVFSAETIKAKGKAPSVGGAFVFSAGSIYSVSLARAYSYIGQGVIIFSAGSYYVKVSPSPVLEPKPNTIWGMEGRPSASGRSLELLPALPVGQDGAYTDPAQDGAWTDFPEDGAYTKIGYEPEFPPPNRYVTSVESKPSNTYAREGKP